MTETEQESLMFYLINDAYLINALLWENFEDIEKTIDNINNDGMQVIKNATQYGFDHYFSSDKELSIKKYNLYKKRFHPFDKTYTKQDALNRAYQDIENIQNIMQPLDKDLILYRNIKPQFCKNYKSGEKFELLGFSSCSLEMHTAGSKQYGSNEDCILAKIIVPKSFPAIRVDLMKDIKNEPDEVILPPMICKIDKVSHNENDKVALEITCLEPKYIDLKAKNKYVIKEDKNKNIILTK